MTLPISHVHRLHTESRFSFGTASAVAILTVISLYHVTHYEKVVGGLPLRLPYFNLPHVLS